MQMHVRNLQAGDHQTDFDRFEGLLQRLPDRLRDGHEVRSHGGFQIEPVIDLGARHDQRVPRTERMDGQERDAAVVAPDKVPWYLSVDDACEQRCHVRLLPAGPPASHSVFATVCGSAKRL